MTASPHASSYDSAAGDIAVRHGLVEITPELRSECLLKLRIGEIDEVLLQGDFEGNGNMCYWAAMGTVVSHIDPVGVGVENPVSLGLVVLNEVGACLWSEDGLLPLHEGTIYRINPRKRHGTVLPDGSSSNEGRFSFVTFDVPVVGCTVEPSPEEVAPLLIAYLTQCLATLKPRRPGRGMAP